MSTPAGYFDQMYAGSEDPWSLRARWYEQRKRALTVASLTRARYRSAFEPGCSVGALTGQLAARCDRLLATDRVPAAVAAARARVAGHPGVRVEVGTVPDGWPAGRFDLLVLSEVAYYLDPAALDALLDRSAGSLDTGGELVAVHWRHPTSEHAQTGDAVHDRLRRDPRFSVVACHGETDFLLDVLVRIDPGDAPPASVAGREGLV